MSPKNEEKRGKNELNDIQYCQNCILPGIRKTMKSYFELTPSERASLLEELGGEYRDFCDRCLSLDLSRGKPNSEQLDISIGLMSVDLSEDYRSENGFDCRNYGILDGLPEMKRFLSEVYGIPARDIVVGGNSSLQLTYQALSTAMLFGLHGSPRPWCREEKVRWICITPGYDRHFRITERLGFELIGVPMVKGQPDMDKIERLVKDPSVKGIWCVPKYSNPSGTTYNYDTVRRLASMECAAPDFVIMWDNAYAVHDFCEDGDILPDIFAEADKYGNRDRILYFSSTSKITFPGGGVAFLAASENQRACLLGALSAETIGFDKLNQLRHLRYFGTAENLRKHMLTLGKVIKKKFDIALKELGKLKGLGIADWYEPRGGYFISLDVLPGTAKRVYELMLDAGVTLTTVGATHPYGIDPTDSNLRLAPTYPSDADLALAMEALCLCIRIAALEKIK